MIPLFRETIRRLARPYVKIRFELRDGAVGSEKEMREAEADVVHELSALLYLLVGVISAAFGLKGFLMPNGFIDGGVMGVSLIVHGIFDIRVSVLVVLFNLPFIVLAYQAIGRRFAVRSIFAIALLALAIYFLPFPAITKDPLLISAFGGIFLGLGIGMAIRGGAIIDGTEVLAIFLSRKTNLTVGNVIMLFNLVIFLAASYYISTEIALYAILTYYAAAKTVDFVIDGIEEYMSVTIISDFSEEIRSVVTGTMRRGCTIIKGQKGFIKDGQPLENTDIVYVIITRLEMSQLKAEIYKIDPQAFIVMASVKDARGGMIKKKPIKMI